MTTPKLSPVTAQRCSRCWGRSRLFWTVCLPFPRVSGSRVSFIAAGCTFLMMLRLKLLWLQLLWLQLLWRIAVSLPSRPVELSSSIFTCSIRFISMLLLLTVRIFDSLVAWVRPEI